MATPRTRSRRYGVEWSKVEHATSSAVGGRRRDRRMSSTAALSGIRVAPAEPGGHLEQKDTGDSRDDGGLGDRRMVAHIATPVTHYRTPALRARSRHGHFRQYAHGIRRGHHLTTTTTA